MTSTTTIGSFAKITKGSGLAKSDLTSHGANPCIHYGELFTQYGAVIDEVRSRTDRDLPVKSSMGDVLMPTSDVTPSGLAKASAMMCSGVGLGGDVLIIRPDRAKVDSRFLAYAIRYDANQVLSLVRGSTVYHLYAADMRHFRLPMLPIAEQAGAADALRDADALTAILEKLMAKKRNIKQGMMQCLLTGHTRLPGFSSDWTCSTIGELAIVTGGGTPSTRVASYWGGGIPWFTPTEIEVEGSGLISCSDRTISNEGLANSSANLLPAGSVLVTSRASIGNCAVAEVPVTTNQGFASMIPKNGRSTWFLYYWILQNKRELESRSAGSTFLEISATKVSSIPLWQPGLDEQESIGRVLRDVDRELDALGHLLQSARAIKQGMMQELLTGRTRIPVEVAAV